MEGEGNRGGTGFPTGHESRLHGFAEAPEEEEGEGSDKEEGGPGVRPGMYISFVLSLGIPFLGALFFFGSFVEEEVRYGRKGIK